MYLTDAEKRILNGQEGIGKQKAMELLNALGITFNAEKLIPIKRAHVALSGQEGDTYWCQLLLEGGARCLIAPTTNPCWNIKALTQHYKISQKDIELAERTIDVYRRIGAKLTFDCTPGLGSNVPFLGEHVAFSESSATPYVNSVIGARSNRESSVSALAASIIGKTPYYGLHIDENRYGDILFDVDVNLKDSYDWGILGYYVGKIAGSKIPVLRFRQKVTPSPEDLLYFGAEAATSGAVALYHIIGITPEATTLEKTFANKRKPLFSTEITDSELLETELSFFNTTGNIELIMLGCPHYTFEQLLQVEILLNNRNINENISFWILSSYGALEIAKRSQLYKNLTRLGVNIVADTCIDEPCWNNFKGKMGVTDSPKCAYYGGARGIKFLTRRLSSCIEIAVKGVVN